MAGIVSKIKDPVMKLLEEQVFNDPELKEPVTYRHFQDSSVDAVTKRPVTTYKDYFVDAVRLRHTNETVKVATGSVEIGAPFFMFRAGDIPPSRKLSKKDLLIDDEGNTLKVVGFVPVFTLVTGVTVAS